MPRPHSLNLKLLVIQQCRNGRTYAEIKAEFGVPKSTLSYWMKNDGLPRDTTRQREHLQRARAKARESIMNNRLDRLRLASCRAKTEFAKIPSNSLPVNKALLAMLYWAEGTKSDKSSGVNFVNTDPLLANLYISLLRKCYSLDESRFRVRVHIHDYHVAKEAISFWSKRLQVPKSQFGKIYVKKRSTQRKFRENFQGICFIHYGDGMIRRELLALGRLIAGE